MGNDVQKLDTTNKINFDRMLTVNGFAQLTGLDRRTIEKRLVSLAPILGPNRGHYYDPTKALPFIYEVNDVHNMDKQLKKENIKLEKYRAEKAKLEVEQLKRELVPIEEVAQVVEREYTAVRAHLLAIPSKMAIELSSVTEPGDIKERLDAAINESLSELSGNLEVGTPIPETEGEPGEPGIGEQTQGSQE